MKAPKRKEDSQGRILAAQKNYEDIGFLVHPCLLFIAFIHGKM
jgi:hypothetical protein